MPLEETPPEKGRASQRIKRWSNLKTARGQTHEVYACGKAHWFDCHTLFGVTQPCLRVVTRGALECPRCSQPVETMGYVACWLPPQLKPSFALVHHDQRDRADKLQRGQPCVVGRDDDKTAGIYIMPRTDDKRRFLKLDSPALLATVDLVPTLLSCWKLPQLVKWFEQEAKRGKVSVAEVRAVEEATEEEIEAAKKQFSPMHRGAAIRYGAVDLDEPAPVSGALNNALARAKEAEKNGKHTAEGGGK